MEKLLGKLVFMFPDVAYDRLIAIENKRSPSERLVGAYELANAGWSVSISDSRWESKLSSVRRKLKRYFEIPNVKSIRDWSTTDCIIVKDDLSLVLTVIAKVLGKKIIYLDSTFVPPKRALDVLALKINFFLVDKVIMFSRSQKELWSEKFNLDRRKIECLQYSMDLSFYPNVKAKSSNEEFNIISVGRDVGRDFPTLIKAISDCDFTLNLVSLPYLIKESFANVSNVTIKERLSYEELFELYSQSHVTVVPLKKSISYPSGIRAVMESMLLGVPVVCSRTPVLEEYFSHNEEIIFYESENVAELKKAINRIREDPSLAKKVASNARQKVIDCFGMDSYVNSLHNVIVRCLKKA